MAIPDMEFCREFIRVCDDGWQLGWHEFHGGNISYRLTRQETEAVRASLTPVSAWVPMDIHVPQLAEELVLVTGSGKCFRDVGLKPEECLGIIEIHADGARYRKAWGFAGQTGNPTSELSAHLMNLAIKKQTTNGKHRVVYHAHPANIIALSFILPLSDEVFTRELWEMEPECAMSFPSGLGVIPWMVPGQKEVSVLTGELMKQYDVVLWAQHGLFCSAATPADALGLMHTVEKAAEILIKCLSISPVKQHLPSVDDFKDMAKAFKLDLPERFLYRK